ncbi:MAG: hypothetical protein ABI685_08440 [Ferruginibacter sp.]
MLEILETYREINSKFMADGILVPEAYAKASTKILWILKEPYGDLPVHYGDDIQKRIDGKKKDSVHTWQRMALASYMILKKIKEIDQVPLWSIYGDSLKELAIINVKKHSGSSTTNMVEFSKFYKRHRKILSEIIKNQISEINPDIVIGGGTLKLIKDDLGERNELGRGHFQIGNRLFINTWHPAQRRLNLFKYSNMVAGRTAELLEAI